MQDFSATYFNYDGKRYFLNINLYSYETPNDLNDDKKYYNFSLNNSNVISLEYSNEFNKLFINGELKYQDNYGVIDKFLDKQFIYIEVIFKEVIQKFDKDITIEKLSETSSFVHKFFVNSIKILDRQKHIITYQLNFLSVHWFQCMSTVNFTNYNKKQESIFNIIKTILMENELIVDTESFKNTVSNVRINYITQKNDNVITAVNYLLSKLYYYKEKDNNLKFLTYNSFTNKYQIVTIDNQDTYLGATNIILSMFRSNTEFSTQNEPNEFNTVTKFPKIHVYQNNKTKLFFDFNYDKNRFVDESIDTKEILAYQNSKFNHQNYKEKYTFFNNKIKYLESGTYWNNTFNIYINSVKMLLEDSSLVINTTGNILVKPGFLLNISLDRDSKDIATDDLNKLDDIKNKYKIFEGLWIVAKVHDIIIPSLIDSNLIRYRQNLVLIRNYSLSID